MFKSDTFASTLRSAAVAFTAAAAAAAAPAQAQPIEVSSNPVPTATVSIADLDLGSSAGLARFKSRVESAARGLCRTTAVEPVDMKLARASCYRQAVASGFKQMEQIVAARNSSSAHAAAALSITAR